MRWALGPVRGATSQGPGQEQAQVEDLRQELNRLFGVNDSEASKVSPAEAEDAGTSCSDGWVAATLDFRLSQVKPSLVHLIAGP